MFSVGWIDGRPLSKELPNLFSLMGAEIDFHFVVFGFCAAAVVEQVDVIMLFVLGAIVEIWEADRSRVLVSVL